MRNAEATRELILNTALDEFSSFGISGARVDRIAKNAGCNKNMIYIYFENKETLFTTVLQKYQERAFDAIPFTPDDLPGFAVKVFDFAISNPKLMRLSMWSNLEHYTINRSKRIDDYDQKIDKINSAQSSGHVGTAFQASFILKTIMSLATAWSETNPWGPSLQSEDINNLNNIRESIARTISLMIESNKL